MSNEIRYFSDGEQATAEVLNRPTKDLGLKEQYMSKAEFESMVQMRRNAYAGSGLIHTNAKYSRLRYINDGGLAVWKNTDKYFTQTNDIVGLIGSNKIYLGDITATNDEHVLYNVNGNILKWYGAYNYFGAIKLPAPATSLGTITDSTSLGFDMKQGDFAILDDLNRELVENGTFDTGIDGWTGTNVSYDDTDKCLVSTFKNIYSTVAKRNGVYTVTGIEYMLTIDIINDDNAMLYMGIDQDTNRILKPTILSTGTHTFTFKGNGRYTLFGLKTNKSYDDDKTVKIKSISIKQVKEQPIVSLQDTEQGIDIYENSTLFEARDSISRQDLVFLETWHEDVSEKDIVYPYGNIQYRGGNTDGLSNIGEGAFAGKETYSLFGNWQSENDLVGLGYKWSDLSNEDKLKFAGNKDNNIYKDGDNIIQVRYRVRVVKGLGNEWENVKTVLDTNSDYYLKYDNTLRVQAKAGRVSFENEFGNRPYDFKTANSPYLELANNIKSNELGIWAAQRRVGFPEIAYDDKCFALPIALVQRRNDGAFDPVYNTEGSGTFTDGKEWFETSDSHNNLTDCFNNKANGYIGTVSGRSDRLFVDEVNERDVEDLRMSALKRPYKEILDEYNSKAITGRIRGKTRNSNILTGMVTRTSDNLTITIPYRTRYKYMDIDTGNFYYTNINGYIYDRLGTSTTVTLPYGTRLLVLSELLCDPYTVDYEMSAPISGYKTYTYNNTLTHCDIIGDPRKLSDRVKYTVVDGTSQTVNLLKNDYVLNDDGHIYRALVARDSIDLDTDDYTNTDNWIDLGTDGSVGGYPQEWLDNGVLGTPLIVGENGESLLPVDLGNDDIYRYTTKIKLSKKAKTLNKIVVVHSDGSKEEFGHISFDPWSGSAGNWANQYSGGNSDYAPFDELFGAITSKYNDLYITNNGEANYNPLTDIIQVFYETFADSFIEDYNSKVLEIANEATIEGDTLHSNNPVSIMTQNLIRKVNTTPLNQNFGLKFKELGFINSSGNRKIDNTYGVPTTLTSLEEISDILDSGSPQVKFFSYLSENNNRLKIQYVFKELKYDETDGWGDDERFQIIDKVSTINDDNGNKVLYGQKSTKLPYFIKD